MALTSGDRISPTWHPIITTVLILRHTCTGSAALVALDVLAVPSPSCVLTGIGV